jgi:hypothetical protein
MKDLSECTVLIVDDTKKILISLWTRSERTMRFLSP